jgi:hypothetical protein
LPVKKRHGRRCWLTDTCIDEEESDDSSSSGTPEVGSAAAIAARRKFDDEEDDGDVSLYQQIPLNPDESLAS